VFVSRSKGKLAEDLEAIRSRVAEFQNSMGNPQENSEIEYMMNNLGNINFKSEIAKFINLKAEEDMFYVQLKDLMSTLETVQNITLLDLKLP
jgi:hypothetical protein